MTLSYDEMVSGKGVLRPHWRQTMAAVWGMPPETLRDRQARAAAHLAEADTLLAQGNDAPDGSGQRPNWSLDLLPLILPEAEWRGIAAGLTQRAQLLNLILDDIYGAQALIQERLLPPYLVYNNPGFLRPLRHVAPAGGAPRLQFYAADLIRMPDGHWAVLSDRTQAPAGVGYALHHRSILARTFPEGFRNTPVSRLQSSIDLWHAGLRSIGGAIAEDPRIVLLTPGPHNSAYLEHVLLAQELGIALAQGSDLTVRGEVVYLKTLDGLEKVDVIYRRVDGDYCDPLELRADSALGVAGLVGALRAGNVIVLNMPGSAAVETPAFAPFLPNLAQRLLGATLSLPAVTTWWCGQQGPLAEVIAGFDRFQLQPVFDPGLTAFDAGAASPEEREALIARVRAQPEAYVAIERVSPSLVPRVDPSGLDPQPVVLRACVLWSDGAWHAVPGGVARVPPPVVSAVSAPGPVAGRINAAAVVKDVWVLAEESDSHARSAAPRAAAVESRRMKSTLDRLGSRTADDLFWLGRYVERLDLGARLFRAVLTRLADSNPGPRDVAEMALLASALARAGWVPAATATLPAESRLLPKAILGAMASSPLNPCQAALRRLGLALRERLSADMWRTLGQVATPPAHLPASAADPDRLLGELNGMVTSIATFGGLVAENMTRGAGWHFLELGRRIERGIGVCGILGSLTGARSAWIELSVRLAFELCDSIITHRKRYLADSYSLPMLDLVLTDGSNPRGLAYQLGALQRHLDVLVGQDPLAGEIQLVDRMVASLADATPISGEPAALGAMTGSLSDSLMALSDMIAHKFFAHIDPARSVIFGTRNAQRAIKTAVAS
jgi:uncharacterized circularly permuted ATP-grasp superfamily protein/uncharacterized alpha-E superfamily protein